MYGGNQEPYRFRSLSEGLSPYVRGKHTHVQEKTSCMGSIPVCTGETINAVGQVSSIQVYPRMYGGNRPISTSYELLKGLSPYVRGKPSDQYQL